MLAAQANTGLGNDVNMLEAMEMFKSIPDKMLPQYAQDPKLALFAAAEMARREDMRKRYAQKAQKPNKPVVAQLAEAIAPSMPQMPPGMNAPQEPQPAQMAPSQQPDMVQQMPQPMQAGLGGLMPEQRMAQGGPVAFAGGLQVPGVSQEFGGQGESVLSEEELAEVRRRARESGFVPELVGNVGLAEVRDIREGRLTPEEVAVKTAIKTGKPLPPRAQEEKPAPAPKVVAQQAAPAPMGIDALLKQAQALRNKLNVPGISVPEGYETRNRAEQIYQENKGRYGDSISPVMEELKKFYEKQASKEDIEKAANRQMALALMGSKERNLLAGLAGGIQAGEDVKKSMTTENRAMQQASLNAQLAHAKYIDAMKRGDYEAAQRAEREERTYNLQVQKLRQDQSLMDVELMRVVAGMQPKGGAGGEKALTAQQRIDLQMKVRALAEPKLQNLKTQYEKKYFKPSNWEQSKEYQDRRAAIIRETYLENAPQLLGAEDVTVEEMNRRLGR